jgi:signal transduction histidine kinase
MNRNFWLQVIAISLLFTTLLAGVSLFVFRGASASISQETRRNTYLFLANILESEPYPAALQRYERYRADARSLGRSVWVLAGNGAVLASNTSEAPPAEWHAIPRPQQRHEIAAKIPGLSNFAELVLVRLDKPEPVFLLVRPEKDTPNRALASVEAGIFLFGLFGTTVTGICMIFVYARRTSNEAREVMARLHAGDLQARFRIRKFDEIGNLKQDFNTMADEIERLVLRLHATENARRELLQELSHDLRTPLTSLRTSIDTLQLCRSRMNEGQQLEFLSVAQSELLYLTRLLDDLFLIADIGEPSHRLALETIDLGQLAADELHIRALAQPQLDWQLQRQEGADLQLECDAHLLLRLLRNALDNAGKFAATRVTVTILATSNWLEMSITDDGPGIAEEAAGTFGTRRKHRLRNDSGQHGMSLGLGSVIIKAIADLHGARINIGTDVAGGTRLRCDLPRKGGGSLIVVQ